MDQKPRLLLIEELLLLALRDREGTFVSGTMVPHSLSGGIVAELLLTGRITLEVSKNPLVTVLNMEPTGHALLDECLRLMASARRRRRISAWGCSGEAFRKRPTASSP